jgi:hypothetical protein
LSAYEMIVPLANMIVRASGSSWRCVEAHEQRSIKETLSVLLETKFLLRGGAIG